MAILNNIRDTSNRKSVDSNNGSKFLQFDFLQNKILENLFYLN